MDFKKEYSLLKIIGSEPFNHIVFFSASIFFIWLASFFTIYVFPSGFTPALFYFMPWAFLIILIYHRSQKFKYEDVITEFIKIVGSLLAISFLFAILIYSVFDQSVQNSAWFYGFYYFIVYVFNFFIFFLGVIFALPLMMSNLAAVIMEKISGEKLKKYDSVPFYIDPLFIISLVVSVPLAIYILGLFPIIVDLLFYSGHILTGFFLLFIHASHLINVFRKKRIV